MNKQEVFDKVSSSLLAQNAKSKSFISRCAYRGDDGMKCGIGFLIADEHYDNSFENKPVTNDGVKAALYASGVDYCKMSILLQELQETHDRFTTESWKPQLRVLAKDQGLTCSF